MPHIQIPLPDFNFADRAKAKAELVCSDELHMDAIDIYFANEQLDATKERKYRLIRNIDELNSREDKIVFISVILNYLSDLIETVKCENSQDEAKYSIIAINNAQYFFYGLAKKVGYNFDPNTFSDKETVDVNDKIDVILQALNELKAGQEVLYDAFDEVKEQIKSDFEALKTDKPLGKRRFYKLALGTIASYSGNKIADEIFAQLRPYIIELLQQTPHLLDGFKKLVS